MLQDEVAERGLVRSAAVHWREAVRVRRRDRARMLREAIWTVGAR